MSPARDLSPEEELLLSERLPWYVNGTLDAAGRAWVDQLLAKSPAAAQRLARERALEAAAERMLVPVAAQDVGLASLLSRVRAERPVAGSKEQPAAGWRAAWVAVQHWLTAPQWAAAMSLAVFAQAGVIAWLAFSDDHAADGQSASRSVGVAEVRTLRVSFRPEASEADIRAALVAVAARIVGGPTQIGEYWVASDSASLEEIRAALLKSNVAATIEADLAGPRGR